MIRDSVEERRRNSRGPFRRILDFQEFGPLVQREILVGRLGTPYFARRANFTAALPPYLDVAATLTRADVGRS